MVIEARFPAGRLEREARYAEERAGWRRAKRLGLQVIYGGQYDPPVAVTAGQQLIGLAERRLRQLGDDVA